MNVTIAIGGVIEQMMIVLHRLTPAQYSQKLDTFHGASLGEHFRHIYEFQECLLNHTEGEILCYDDRKRSLDLQNSMTLLYTKFESFKDILLKNPKTNYLLEVKHFLGEAGDCYVNSSFHRELLFVFDHTIHHLAIIRIGIESEIGPLILPKDFGFTPSTTRYHNFINSKN